MGDVIAVVTSKVETKCNTELAKARLRLKEAEAEVERLNNTANDMAAALCHAAAKVAADSLKPVVEPLGGRVVILKKESYNCQRQRNDSGKLWQAVQVRGNGISHYNNATDLAVEVEPSAELLDLEEQLVKAKAAVPVCQDEAMAWRKKLSELPMLERRARGKLAEGKLAESTDGQKVLAMLADGLEDEFLALPG